MKTTREENARSQQNKEILKTSKFKSATVDISSFNKLFDKLENVETIDSSSFNKLFHKLENIETSSYQKDIKREKALKKHQREEETKDLKHTLVKDFSHYFSITIKLVISIYIILLVLNIVLGKNYNLDKLELIVYTFLTTSVGILIDRTIFKKQEQ